MGKQIVINSRLDAKSLFQMQNEEMRYILDPFSSFLRKGETFAIAVSGGADSLALCLLSHNWSKTTGRRIVALIVDHGLRENSSREARKVAGWLETHGIDNHILSWEAAKPKSGIQAAARTARYDLMTSWCKEHKINALLTAHHLEDQVETFLLRIERGSRLDGLSSMEYIQEYRDFTIIRPLLHVSKKRLRESLISIGQEWIEDPSNRDTKFRRTKLRILAEDLDKKGLSYNRIFLLVRKFSRLRHALAEVVSVYFDGSVALFPEGYATANFAILRNLPNQIIERILVRFVFILSNRVYPPRYDRLCRAVENIRSNQVSSVTLGGCRFIVNRGKLFVFRDWRSISVRQVVAGERFNWDDFFSIEISDSIAQGCKLSALGKKGWLEVVKCKPELKDHIIPYPVRTTLPALFDTDGVIEVPGLGYSRNEHSRYYLGIKNIKFDSVFHGTKT